MWELDYTGRPFVFFGGAHLAALGGILALNLWFVVLRSSGHARTRVAFRYATASALLLNEAVWFAWTYATGQWDLRTILPLHLCSMMVYVGAAALVTKRQSLYELLYFLGIGGALQALMTPNLGRYGFPHIYFLSSFVSHGLILSAAVYLTVVEGLRPTRDSLRRTFIIGNLLLLLVGIVNRFTGGNYMYISHKPDTPTILDALGPWPWYIAGMEILGLLTMLVLYLPFALADARGGARRAAALFVLAVVLVSPLVAASPRFEARFILQPQTEHVHSSSIVELPDGDLFAVYYRGGGERRADDVRLEGARLAKGGAAWSAPFPVADTPGFPDCNPIAYVDTRGNLSVVWPAILDNRWESALLRSRAAPTASWRSGPPPWSDGGVILLRPDNLQEKTEPFARSLLATLPPGAARDEVAQFIERLADKLYNRLGWMPRSHALRLPGGRILLPLYSDTFSLGLIAVSDDDGATWRASDPIVSLGGVQPSLVRKQDGTIVAYMRDNGPPPQRVIVASSRDDGMTWTAGTDSEVPNPGSSVEVIALRDGSWLMVLNDTEDGRARLSAWLSEDEGRTWPHRRAIEDAPGGSYSYPSVLQSEDGLIHVSYSHVGPAPAQGGRRLEAIKHVAFEPEWVRGGSPGG
jgi:hypothetical integral membrane protein (TIGR02206 family)